MKEEYEMNDLAELLAEYPNDPVMKMCMEVMRLTEEAQSLFHHRSNLPEFKEIMACYIYRIWALNNEACRLNHEGIREIERKCSSSTDPEFIANVVKVRDSINETYLKQIIVQKEHGLLEYMI
jgi:hypothetical protein